MFFKKQKPKEQEPKTQEPTNRFYVVLKEKVVAAVSVTFARMNELREQIDKAEQKLSHEIDVAKNYNKRRAKLKEVCGERIMESQTSYEKYNVEQRKLRLKAEVSDEIVVALRDEFIPKLKSDYDKVHAEFVEKLNDVAKSLRYIGVAATEAKAKEVMQHFENLLTEQLNFAAAWTQIYGEFGEKFHEMYGASFTLPAILPRSITHDNIVYVQKFLEPERATLNHPLQTAPVEPEPIKEKPIESKPVEPSVDEKPVETSAEKPDEETDEESLPKYRRECEKCCEDFQTTEADVMLCADCQKEANRLSLLVTTPDLKPAATPESKDAEVKQEDIPAVEKKESISVGPIQDPEPVTTEVSENEDN